MPSIFPPFPEREEFDLHASLEPAREVGGDLYDFFLLDDDHLCLAIGDVSGKGVPASLFMAVTITLLRAAGHLSADPADVLAASTGRSAATTTPRCSSPSSTACTASARAS